MCDKTRYERKKKKKKQNHKKKKKKKNKKKKKKKTRILEVNILKRFQIATYIKTSK